MAANLAQSRNTSLADPRDTVPFLTGDPPVEEEEEGDAFIRLRTQLLFLFQNSVRWKLKG